MGEVLCMGLTHYPGLLRADEEMSVLLRRRLEDPAVPEEWRQPQRWPVGMQDEWARDGGGVAAAQHRAAVLDGVDRLRAALDTFQPDFIVMWGDDQYENFRDDVIPAFCVLAYDDLEAKPWEAFPYANYWHEPTDATFKVRGSRQAATHIVSQLLADEFDVAYAYKPLHHPSLPHSFLNALLLLDHGRSGFDVPLVPITVNCYGRRVISSKGKPAPLGLQAPFDPTSPSPRRCFDLGRATARIVRDSPWRVALVASSSWSHAFLTDKHYRLFPDVASDRVLYQALVDGDWRVWRDLTLEAVENSGQQEILNWACLAGAMEELGASVDWSSFIETYLFNSTKVIALCQPV